MTKEWNHKVLIAVYNVLPKKYLDGSYIEHRVCFDEFNKDDVNEKYYYLMDILPSQLYVKWRDTDKRYHLSAGECTTIFMMENCRELYQSLDIINLLLIAYFHDLDSILCRCFPGKIIGKIHRRNTNRIAAFKRGNDLESNGYWHKNCKKYLPLQKSDFDIIEAELVKMSMEKRIEMFDSNDFNQFADHFCRVIEMAFGTKEILLKTFSMEACEAALDYLDNEIEEGCPSKKYKENLKKV